jgi:RNA polymerase sigma-70 factor (ECF subfamily)
VNDRGGDERELVRRCREGSEAAYAELVRAHRGRLYALAYRLTNDNGLAEDVVQETFLAAFRSIEKVEPNPSLSPWLNTIAIRTARRVAGRRAARPVSSLDRATHDDDPSTFEPAPRPGDVSGDPFEAAQAAEIRREIAAAIGELPFKHRVAVVLRFVMGLDYAEAAAMAGVPLNSFKSDLLRGTRALRERLGPRLTVETDLPAETREPPLAGRYIAPSRGLAPSVHDGPNGRHPTDARPTVRAAAGAIGTDVRN